MFDVTSSSIKIRSSQAEYRSKVVLGKLAREAIEETRSIQSARNAEAGLAARPNPGDEAVRRLVGPHGGWSETELAGCAGHRRRNGAPRRHVANSSHQYLPTYSSGTTTTICAHKHNDIHISDLKRPANPSRLSLLSSLSFAARTHASFYLELPRYRAFPLLSPVEHCPCLNGHRTICKFGDGSR